MNAKILLSVGILLVLSLGGCATVQPESHFKAVQTLGRERVQTEVVWSQDAKQVQENFQHAVTLAQDGLTRDEAAHIAILNNRTLQAELENLGLAAAELTQAGLLQNPTLEAFIAFPLSVGSSGLGLIGWLSDLWQVPRRKRVAALAARQAEYTAAWHVVLTAYTAAHAWDAVVATRQLLHIEQELLIVRGKAALRLQIRYGHGLADTIEMEETLSMQTGQEIAVHEAKQAVTRAVTLLAQTLALDNAADFIPTNTLETIHFEQQSLQVILQHAMDNRLDLAIAHAEVERKVKQQELERALIWKTVLFGPRWEGDFGDIAGGENSIGPAVSIELPIFDQNQAGIAASSYHLRQAIRRLEALQRLVAKEVVEYYRGLDRIHAALLILENILLPSTDLSLNYAEEWNHKMQLPFITVLAEQAHQLEVQRRIVQTRKMLNDKWRMLQLARLGASPHMP
jgi:cobalt-zinc-cadmium efflux system outer membrane protein